MRSSGPTAGLAPVDQGRFDARFVPDFVSTGSYFIQFLPGGRFRENDRHPGDYTYANTGPDTGTVTQTYDDATGYGGGCTIEFTFTAATEGTLRYTCVGGHGGTENWRRDTVDTSAFNIDLVWRTPRSSSVGSAARAAVARWERIVTGDTPAVYLAQSSHADFGIVDDLRIYAHVQRIDGPRGTAASASLISRRTGNKLPAVAAIYLDEDDLPRVSAPALYSIVLHDIAHALGFGLSWNVLGLLAEPSSGVQMPPLPDTHFTGPKAVAAFDAAGGTGYAGKKVPVQNTESSNAHWRESVFGAELMVPTVHSRATQEQPISAITVQSLADMGYTVNASAADSYVLHSIAREVRSRRGAFPGRRVSAPLRRDAARRDPRRRADRTEFRSTPTRACV